MDYQKATYSSSYHKEIEQDHLEYLRHGRSEAIHRSKKLQHETNKRRKAQAIKRKAEAQKEEKRRQEILQKRKQEIREATERFQRQNKGYSKDEQEEFYHPSRATPGLEEALRAVRGSSASIRRPPRQTSAGTRASSAGPVRQHGLSRQDSNSSIGSNHSTTNMRGVGGGMDDSRGGSASRKRPDSSKSLHDKSLRNLTNSRSLFEQQLEQHQQLLMDQQQQSLFHFNEAILMEMERDKKLRGEEEEEGKGDASVLMTESVSSMDSLENSCREKENGVPSNSAITNGNDAGNTYNGVENVTTNPTAISSASPVASTGFGGSGAPGFVLHRSSSSTASSNVAVVQPMTNTVNHQQDQNNTYDDQKHTSVNQMQNQHKHLQHQHSYSGERQGNVSGHQGAHDLQLEDVLPDPVENDVGGAGEGGVYGTIQTSSNGRYNGQFYQDSVVNFAHGTNPQTNGMYYDSGHAHMNMKNGYNHQNYTEHYNVQSDPYQTNKAWNAGAPTSQYGNTSNPVTNHYENTNQNQQSYVTNSKPFSSRTTATNATITTGYTHTTQTTTGSTANTKGDVGTYATSAYNSSSAALYNQFGLDPSTIDPNDPYMSSMFTSGLEQPMSYSTQTTTESTTPNTKPSVPSTTTPSQQRYQTSSANTHQPSTRSYPYSSTNQQNNSSTHQTQSYTSSQYLSSTAISSNRAASVSVNRSYATTTTTSMSAGHPVSTATYAVATPVSSKPTPTAGKSAIPTIHDEAAKDDDSQSSEEKEEEVPKRSSSVIKGILKKPGHEGSPKKSVRIGGIIGQGAHRPMKKTATNQSIIRDSLEVSREHLHGKKEKKESSGRRVRFWDMVYEEEGEEEEEQSEEENEEPPQQTQPKLQPEPPSKPKPHQRPVSAKVISQRPPAATPVTRVQSANSTRRQTFIRPHPPSAPPSGRATMAAYQNQAGRNGAGPAQGSNTSAMRYGGNSTGGAVVTQPATTNIKFNSGNGDSANKGNSKIPVPMSSSAKVQPKSSDTSPPYHTSAQKSSQMNNQNQPNRASAIYDSNGMRLDRTPTDEEINWLWDKVRTCLHRENTEEEAPEQPPKQTAVNTKYFDGNNLSPAYRVAPRSAGGTNNGGNYNSSNYGNGGSVGTVENTPVKKKVTMDTLNTYSRRAALLQQRKNTTNASQQHPNNPAVAASTTVHTTVHSLHGYQPPIQSSTQPAPANPNFYTQQHQQQQGGQEPVSESLAGFIAAETLAAHSASESEIEHAMMEAQIRQHTLNSHRTQQPKVSSALSIEEQRLVQSLERLNERLRIQEAGLSNPPGAFVPRPPTATVNHSGFRGHQPKQTAARRHVNINGTVTRHNFNRVPATSAPARNYHSAVRYR